MVCEFAYPKVMQYFEEISAIPRGSYHEEQIAAYLVDFAEARGLSYVRDAIGNVLINLPASAGMEQKAPVLLQGHTDMVCEKNEGVEHDFLKDPLKLYVKDGWLRAEGTTLGADNGVAVAVMLAVLDGAAEAHPALQCLFTVSEEVGLDGAKAFDYSQIYARKMLNMDSADESSMIAGCAGGLRSTLTLPIAWEPCGGMAYQLRITGLFGGHSGEDINRGRANADKVLGRILWELSKQQRELRLIRVKGGSKDNAIPREAEAVLTLPRAEDAETLLTELSGLIRAELCRDDRAFAVTLEPLAEPAERCFDRVSTDRAIFLLAVVANGIFAMNTELPDLVEFSRNLGVVSTEEEHVEFIFSSRSARDSQIDASASELDAYAAQLGASVRHYNRYPGWTFAEQSVLREEYIAAYRSLYGTNPKIEVIHAGLECGIIKQAIPDMDMLSCGPIVLNLHSPDEALHLASFERFVTLIFEILKR
ncbi:MAG: aminoacyl-histidine dipeptidase [Clostridia bacterium]|nr:aminoacyl-histidine dipeptidase [Clostridia bacterium]